MSDVAGFLLSGEEYFVYLYSDPIGRPVYAGCTGNLKQRGYHHKCRSSWWAPDLTVTSTRHPFIEDALEAEAELINRLRPYGNTRIPPLPTRRDGKLDEAAMAIGLHRVADAARLLGLTEAEVHELADGGSLHRVDIGTSRSMPRITVRSVVDYQKRHGLPTPQHLTAA